MTWSQPLCDACWRNREHDRLPVRLIEVEVSPEICCACGRLITSGIYARIDSATVPLPETRRSVRYEELQPPPPRNVVLVLLDGTRVPVDCHYVGEQEGMRIWEVVTQVDADRVAQVTIDEMPPRTSVRMTLPGGSDE